MSVFLREPPVRIELTTARQQNGRTYSQPACTQQVSEKSGGAQEVADGRIRSRKRNRTAIDGLPRRAISRPSFATRRCVLVNDGGCGRLQPEIEFRGIRHEYHDLCATCRTGGGVEQRARLLYESGAKAEEVADSLSVTINNVYGAAKRYGWDREARRRSQSARAEGDVSCARPTCNEPHLPDKEHCAEHERIRMRRTASRLAKSGGPEFQCTADGCYRPRLDGGDLCYAHKNKVSARERLRVPVAAATVTIRCHVCYAHRQATLAVPGRCGRCGAEVLAA